MNEEELNLLIDIIKKYNEEYLGFDVTEDSAVTDYERPIWLSSTTIHKYPPEYVTLHIRFYGPKR